MNWWQDVLDRTSWLELIAAFVSVVASVLVALWIQRRDFKKRTDEALDAERQRQRHVEAEVRRDLIEKTLALVDDVRERADTPRSFLPGNTAGRAKDLIALYRLLDVPGGDSFADSIGRFITGIVQTDTYGPAHTAEMAARADALRDMLVNWHRAQL